MLVYCRKYFLIYVDRIFLSKSFYPILFKFVLIVGRYLSAYVIEVLWR